MKRGVFLEYDLQRYSRQILFQPIGEEGQIKLLKDRKSVV